MNENKKWAVPIFSIGLWSWRGTNPWLDGVVKLRWPWQLSRFTGVLGWGYRESGQRAQAWANRAGVATLRLEDGFLRSVALGVQGGKALSVVIDDLGIYYDASRPSRLETIVQETVAASTTVQAAAPVVGDTVASVEASLADAQHAMALILRHGLSKYNHAPDFAPPTGWRGDEILVIDQTFGDVAVRLGGGDEQSFHAMLSTALDENPLATVWIKTHPDVMCGKKRGYLVDGMAAHPRVRLLPVDVNPLSLLRCVGKVYAVSSQMGFEALLCGRPVVTFGLPWYGCWGLTDDRHPGAPLLAKRRGRASLPQVFHAAYLRYCRYMNPETGLKGDIFDVIGHLADRRRVNDQMRGELVCVGLSLWKRSIVAPFLRQGAATLRFLKTADELRHLPPVPLRRVVLWGAGREDVKSVSHELKLPTLRMEDGFIRSVGLGSNLVAPLSLVVDDLGIYFDPRAPSRLEAILLQTEFDARELQDAQALRESLVSARIGKYNVGLGGVSLPVPRPSTVILVPGQVEDDASIRTGAPWISTNLGLLAAVRAANPDAFVIFKPHPDVVSGNRKGTVSEDDTARFADKVVPEADVIACLEHVDEVHTMTSLTGFEALLRGKRVVCYGAPFYAGWGLTDDVFAGDAHSTDAVRSDMAAIADQAGNPGESGSVWERRTRRLILDELVAGTLLRYPRYVSPETRSPITARSAVALLRKQKASSGGTRLKRNRVIQQIGKLRMLIQAISVEFRALIKRSIVEKTDRWFA
jgi:capsular polysaccharide export protein